MIRSKGGWDKEGGYRTMAAKKQAHNVQKRTIGGVR